jgi:2-methylcitrate dehydratase PrpD
LTVSPHVLELTGKKTPQVGLEGKFSVYHSAAVAIIFGAAGEKEYSDELVRDPKVIALRDRVNAVVDPKMRDDEARIRIVLKDGRVLEKLVTHAIGSLERPLSNADLEGKFHVLVDDVLGQAQASSLLALTWDIENVADAAEICRACAPSAGNTRRRA